MRRHAEVELTWGDGEYSFRLGLAEIEEVEEKRGRGIFQIAARLSPASLECTTLDIREVLRLGLIGGGMKPVDALAKVRKYVDERPIDESRDTAYAVMLAALLRVKSDEKESQSGEAGAAEAVEPTSPQSEPQPRS